MIRSVVLDSPLGLLRVFADERGLVALDFLKTARPVASESKGKTAVLKLAEKSLRDYFEKGKPLPRLPLGVLGGTEFHRKVWRAMEKIPFGETRSYGEIAAAAGSPGAARAVGTACKSNPLALFIPCHRVVAANGLGGYNSGLDIKKKLLRLEGVSYRD